MATIPPALLSKVEICISRYRLIGGDGKVIAALSGGKDSIFLCLALRDLNIPHMTVVVDMGYEPGWGEKIVAMVRVIGINPRVVAVRDPNVLSEQVGVRRRLEIVDAGGKSESHTPCTYCHGAKITVLQRIADEEGAQAIAVGQHQTDAVVSMLKEALMHVDHQRSGGHPFSRQRYRRLVEDFGREAERFPEGETPIIDAVGKLVGMGVIDTDEPPAQGLGRDSAGRLIRPLFEVSEREIIHVRDTLNLETAGSGCHHGLNPKTYTPREMIHYGVMQRLENPDFDAWSREMLLQGISPDGSGLARSRERRAELLGSAYKPVAGQLEKYSLSS